jgi:hypothetical protein
MKIERFLSQSLALLGRLIGSVAGVNLPFNKRRPVEIVDIKHANRMKKTASDALRNSVMPDAGALQPFNESELRRANGAAAQRCQLRFLNAWSGLCQESICIQQNR